MYDSYPFGMLVPNRNYSSNSYRYGFQNQEKDDEVKGSGNSINYKYRMHDPRVGSFFAIDPLADKFPMLTPYQFSSNNPIGMLELEGLEGIKHSEYDISGKLIRHVVTMRVFVVTVDALDKSVKQDLRLKFGKKAANKIINERVRSSYSSYDLKGIKETYEAGYANKVNSKGEKVDFVFDVRELHLDSKSIYNKKDLRNASIFYLGIHSGEVVPINSQVKHKGTNLFSDEDDYILNPTSISPAHMLLGRASRNKLPMVKYN